MPLSAPRFRDAFCTSAWACSRAWFSSGRMSASGAFDKPFLQEGMGLAHGQAACHAACAGAAHAVGKKKKTVFLINENRVLIRALFSSLIRLPRYAH